MSSSVSITSAQSALVAGSKTKKPHREKDKKSAGKKDKLAGTDSNIPVQPPSADFSKDLPPPGALPLENLLQSPTDHRSEKDIRCGRDKTPAEGDVEEAYTLSSGSEKGHSLPTGPRRHRHWSPSSSRDRMSAAYATPYKRSRSQGRSPDASEESVLLYAVPTQPYHRSTDAEKFYRRRDYYVRPPLVDRDDFCYGRPDPWDDRHYAYMRMHPSSRPQSEVWAPMSTEVQRRISNWGRSRSPCQRLPSATVTLQSMSSTHQRQLTTQLSETTVDQPVQEQQPKQPDQVTQSIPTKDPKPVVKDPVQYRRIPGPKSAQVHQSSPVRPSTSMLQPSTPKGVTKEIQTEGPVSSQDSSDSEQENASPEQEKIFEELPISPSEEVTKYTDLIRKVAVALGFSALEQQPHLSDVVFEVLHRDISTLVSLPLSTVLLQSLKATWVHPASAPTSTKKLDNMYNIQETSASFLYTHPKPNSLIISSSSRERRSQSTLLEKDNR